MSKPFVSPSIIAADFSHLAQEVAYLNETEADMLHLDVADGVFAPNITLGFPVLEAIARHSKLPLDFHLMLHDTEKYLSRYVDLGAHSITVHFDPSNQGMHRLLRRIRELGCEVGVALSLHLPVSQIEVIAPLVDRVLIMAVDLGNSGQPFSPLAIQKISQAKTLLKESGSKAKVAIDGGICKENALQVLDAGADILVLGKYVFSAKDKARAIADIKALSIMSE